MTLNTFLKKLRKTPRRWELTPIDKEIRIKNHIVLCPIAKVFGERTNKPLRWRKKTIAEVTEFEDRVLAAADNNFWRDLLLRNELLRACGLKEEGG